MAHVVRVANPMGILVCQLDARTFLLLRLIDTAPHFRERAATLSSPAARAAPHARAARARRPRHTRCRPTTKPAGHREGATKSKVRAVAGGDLQLSRWTGRQPSYEADAVDTLLVPNMEKGWVLDFLAQVEIFRKSGNPKSKIQPMDIILF